MSAEKTVLVIEDDPQLCNSILKLLQEENYRCIGVSSSREALFRLQNQKYSCILVDLKLGEEKGEDLIATTRSRRDLPNRTTPILVITGNLDKQIATKMAGQVQGIVVKPFDPNTLLEKLNAICK